MSSFFAVPEWSCGCTWKKNTLCNSNYFCTIYFSRIALTVTPECFFLPYFLFLTRTISLFLLRCRKESLRSQAQYVLFFFPQSLPTGYPIFKINTAFCFWKTGRAGHGIDGNKDCCWDVQTWNSGFSRRCTDHEQQSSLLKAFKEKKLQQEMLDGIFSLPSKEMSYPQTKPLEIGTGL